MIRKAAVLGLVFISALCAGAQAAAPSKREAQDAITLLERSVTGPGVAQAAKTIVVYAQLSDDVVVNIGDGELPWLSESWELGRDEAQSCQSLLMAAFVAGNVRSQLKSGKAMDDTYAGWVFAIDVYRRLSAKYGFKSASIDALEKMELDGSLQRHAKDLESEEEQAEPSDSPRRPAALLGRPSPFRS